MSQAQIEQFYTRVNNDPALLNQLVAGAQSPDEFIDRAVAAGAENGFTFSREDADSWINKQIDAKANGELSDLQLEGVAGGKTNGQALDGAIQGVGSVAASFVSGLSGLVSSESKKISDWFVSW